jgi:hypothetical protein
MSLETPLHRERESAGQHLGGVDEMQRMAIRPRACTKVR